MLDLILYKFIFKNDNFTKRPCGWKRITSKRRSCAGGRWAPWASTASGASSRCRGPFGTARRRATVSKRNLVPSCATGTATIRTRRPGRSANWPKLLDWPPPKCRIGSKTGGKGTGQPSTKTGQLYTLLCYQWPATKKRAWTLWLFSGPPRRHLYINFSLRFEQTRLLMLPESQKRRSTPIK